MLENPMNPLQNPQLLSTGYSEDLHTRQYNTALNGFKATLLIGKIFRLKSRALHRQPYLYDLNTIRPSLLLHGSCYSGTKAVSIRSIIGSEGRTSDFDMEFHPISETRRERWVGVALAYLNRLPLPPIQLIEVGDAYFVRDGHHRISVARAFGQIAMDAELITWKAEPPFPWQPAEASGRLFSQKRVRSFT